MDEQADIIQSGIAIIEPALIHILEVKFEHIGIGAEGVACVAALVKVLEKADCRDDEFAVSIDEHITHLMASCLNFNHAHRGMLLSQRGKKSPYQRIEHKY